MRRSATACCAERVMRPKTCCARTADCAAARGDAARVPRRQDVPRLRGAHAREAPDAAARRSRAATSPTSRHSPRRRHARARTRRRARSSRCARPTSHAPPDDRPLASAPDLRLRAGSTQTASVRTRLRGDLMHSSTDRHPGSGFRRRLLALCGTLARLRRVRRAAPRAALRRGSWPRASRAARPPSQEIETALALADLGPLAVPRPDRRRRSTRKRRVLVRRAPTSTSPASGRPGGGSRPDARSHAARAPSLRSTRTRRARPQRTSTTRPRRWRRSICSRCSASDRPPPRRSSRAPRSARRSGTSRWRSGPRGCGCCAPACASGAALERRARGHRGRRGRVGGRRPHPDARGRRPGSSRRVRVGARDGREDRRGRRASQDRGGPGA